jgi:hypothetical protein
MGKALKNPLGRLAPRLEVPAEHPEYNPGIPTSFRLRVVQGTRVQRYLLQRHVAPLAGEAGYIYAYAAGSCSVRPDRCGGCGELCDQGTLLLHERASSLDRVGEIEQPGTWSRFIFFRSWLHG